MLVRAAEIHRREQQHHRRDDHKRHDGEPYIAHAGRKADGHREEQRSNLLRCARRGAEAHEPKRTRHGDARAEVAVHQHDDKLHHGGQNRERDSEALRRTRTVHGNERRADAEQQRHRRTDEKRDERQFAS